MIKKIPSEVLNSMSLLEKAGFEAYIVGGCVRDMLMDKQPRDWDLTTNAKPQEIQTIFPNSFYENTFGTVGVKIEKFLNNENLNPEREYDILEITTFRTEEGYSDKRRPDKIIFAEKIEQDLARRDFTMNAIALRVTKGSNFEIIDPYFGQTDIKKGLIRAVGDANERFSEDALRMMRAIRFHSELGFEIEKDTLNAIKKNSELIKHVANERIRDEFSRIILSENPAEGVELMRKTGILSLILPEIEKGVGIKQNRHHIFTIYKHCLLSLKHCPSKKLEVRLAALMHDIAKPQTKRGEGDFATFYNHDHLGAKIAEKILQRLKFPLEITKKVGLLVDNHMFYYNPEEVTESSVRRLIKKVGIENMKDLIDLRIADRLGSGVPKAKPYKLRHLEYIIDKVSSDAVSVKMLKISGHDLMKSLNLQPGPKIGAILDVLLSEVIEDSTKNNREKLLKRALELQVQDLESLRVMAKDKIEEKKEEEDKAIKNKHWVK